MAPSPDRRSRSCRRTGGRDAASGLGAPPAAIVGQASRRGSPCPGPARSATVCIARPTSASCRVVEDVEEVVGDAAQVGARRRPQADRARRSVRTASAPRASVTHVSRSTRPSATSRSMSRVTPLLLSRTWSASWRIRIRRPGASAMVSRASYSANERSCSARSSSSSRRETRACASRNARHGPRRGSWAVSRRAVRDMVIAGMLQHSDVGEGR